jgi:DNA-directed RNA polymerase subunit RPC12/RpoP
LLITASRQGSGTGEFLSVMADFRLTPCLGKPAMDYSDRVLKCQDCGAEFVFTAGEQLFFHDKQFTNDPKRCKQCKAKRASGGSKVRPETRTRCAQCGEETTASNSKVLLHNRRWCTMPGRGKRLSRFLA